MNRRKSNLIKSQIVIHAKHDQVFRKALENPIVAREFINSHLPEELLKIINLDSLRLEKDSYISLALNNSTSDILFSVNFKQKDGQAFLLIEHQSSVDHFIAYRMLKYKTDIWDRYRIVNPTAKRLPLIFSILVYNGTRNYNASFNLWQLNDMPELQKEYWLEGYKLVNVVNVHEIPDSELKKRLWSGTLEYFLKHIKDPKLLEKWEEIMDILPNIAESSTGIDYIRLLLNYTLTAINEDDKIKLEKLLTKFFNKQRIEVIMGSIAQAWIEEGFEKGIQKGKTEGKIEGKIEIIKIMLRNGTDINVISRQLGVSVKEIEKMIG